MQTFRHSTLLTTRLGVFSTTTNALPVSPTAEQSGWQKIVEQRVQFISANLNQWKFPNSLQTWLWWRLISGYQAQNIYHRDNKVPTNCANPRCTLVRTQSHDPNFRFLCVFCSRSRVRGWYMFESICFSLAHWKRHVLNGCEWHFVSWIQSTKTRKFSGRCSVMLDFRSRPTTVSIRIMKKKSQLANTFLLYICGIKRDRLTWQVWNSMIVNG